MRSVQAVIADEIWQILSGWNKKEIFCLVSDSWLLRRSQDQSQ
jgi:hypothetical protein